MKTKLKTIIAVVGQTTTGKSDLAVEIALAHNGEVISADSRQVYKKLDYGSGKITAEEMRGVPHHMLDVADVDHVYTVAEYAKTARAVIKDIFARGKTPIICGGTGLYIDAVLKDFDFDNTPENAKVRELFDSRTLEENIADLQERNPDAAATIDLNNSRRVLRALEKAYSPETSAGSKEAGGEAIFDRVIWIGLRRQPDVLRKAIRERLVRRLNTGMIEEVRGLIAEGVPHERLEQLGLEYRYLSRGILGEMSKHDMIEELIVKIRQYAKRQLTWFKRNPEITWLDPDVTNVVEESLTLIGQFDNN